jgi:hypothetical protein
LDQNPSVGSVFQDGNFPIIQPGVHQDLSKIAITSDISHDSHFWGFSIFHFSGVKPMVLPMVLVGKRVCHFDGLGNLRILFGECFEQIFIIFHHGFHIYIYIHIYSCSLFCHCLLLVSSHVIMFS